MGRAGSVGAVTPFGEATPGQESFVYSGKTVTDMEFGFLTDLDYLDDVDDSVVLTRQRWRLVEEILVVKLPSILLCVECNGDGEVADGTEKMDCPRCDGDGNDPRSGEVLMNTCLHAVSLGRCCAACHRHSTPHMGCVLR
jgi:hypothetical protein